MTVDQRQQSQTIYILNADGTRGDGQSPERRRLRDEVQYLYGQGLQQAEFTEYLRIYLTTEADTAMEAQRSTFHSEWTQYRESLEQRFANEMGEARQQASSQLLARVREVEAEAERRCAQNQNTTMSQFITELQAAERRNSEAEKTAIALKASNCDSELKIFQLRQQEEAAERKYQSLTNLHIQPI